jgi:hypothetical protein
MLREKCRIRMFENKMPRTVIGSETGRNRKLEKTAE